MSAGIAASATSAEAPRGLDNDFVFPGLKGPGLRTPGGMRSIIGPGYATFGGDYVLRDKPTYTLRLASNGQGNVELLRGALQRAVNQVNQISTTKLTVAAGTVPDQVPDREAATGEIVMSVDSSSTCGGSSWAGCGGPRYSLNAATNVATVESGRIWIHPVVLGYSTVNQDHVVAHELGHALGLAHFADAYNGVLQMMNPSSYASGGTYQAGDKNGLRYLQPQSTSKPIVGVVDQASSVGGGKVRLRGWAFDGNDSWQSIRVDVYENSLAAGNGRASIPANLSRPDVNAAYGITGNHGFDGTFSAPIGAHRYCLYAVGPAQNANIGCVSVNVAAPLGAYDTLTSPAAHTVRLTGWAFDPAISSASIRVHIYENSLASGNGRANLPATVTRPDVNRVYAITGNHGFDGSLTGVSTGTHTYCAFAVSGSINKPLGCKSVAVK